MREIVNEGVWTGIKHNPERFDALEQAGFKVNRYGDIYDNLYVRFGGHYGQYTEGCNPWAPCGARRASN